MNEEARKLRTWIEPKEVQIHTLKQNIAVLELQISHIEINIKNRWFIKQQKKRIREAENDLIRKIAELDMDQLESDLEKGFIGRLEKIKLEELKIQLSIEENSLKEVNKKVTMAMRNHKIDEIPIEEQDKSKPELKPGEKVSDKAEKETHAGGTPENPTYRKPGFGRLPPEEKQNE